MMQLSFWGYDDDGVTCNQGKRIVYFVACGDFVKIGFTTRDMDTRLGEMSTGNPAALELIGTLVVTEKQDDRGLQKRFSKYHYRNEWFHKTLELLEAIDKLIEHHEIEVDGFDLDLTKPLFLSNSCPICRHHWPMTSPRPVEVIGENKPGAILGALMCDCCDTPFVIRIRQPKESGIRMYPDGTCEIRGWSPPYSLEQMALLRLCGFSLE